MAERATDIQGSSADTVDPTRPLSSNSDFQDEAQLTPKAMTRLGLGLEFSLLLLALLLSEFGLFDRRQTLGQQLADLQARPFELMAWTAAGLLGLGVLASAMLLLPFGPFVRYREMMFSTIAPWFRHMSTGQIALVAIAAGIGEEYLFRWSIQGGLENWLPSVVAITGASVLFGLLHCVSLMYVAFAIIAGLILGLQMYGSGSVLPAAAAHGLFDLWALLFLVRRVR